MKTEKTSSLSGSLQFEEAHFWFFSPSHLLRDLQLQTISEKSLGIANYPLNGNPTFHFATGTAPKQALRVTKKFRIHFWLVNYSLFIFVWSLKYCIWTWELLRSHGTLELIGPQHSCLPISQTNLFWNSVYTLFIPLMTISLCSCTTSVRHRSGRPEWNLGKTVLGTNKQSIHSGSAGLVTFRSGISAIFWYFPIELRLLFANGLPLNGLVDVQLHLQYLFPLYLFILSACQNSVVKIYCIRTPETQVRGWWAKSCNFRADLVQCFGLFVRNFLANLYSSVESWICYSIF